MDHEKAYQMLDGVLKQLTLKREEHQMLKDALVHLYNMALESVQLPDKQSVPPAEINV